MNKEQNDPENDENSLRELQEQSDKIIEEEMHPDQEEKRERQKAKNFILFRLALGIAVSMIFLLGRDKENNPTADELRIQEMLNNIDAQTITVSSLFNEYDYSEGSLASERLNESVIAREISSMIEEFHNTQGTANLDSLVTELQSLTDQLSLADDSLQNAFSRIESSLMDLQRKGGFEDVEGIDKRTDIKKVIDAFELLRSEYFVVSNALDPSIEDYSDYVTSLREKLAQLNTLSQSREQVDYSEVQAILESISRESNGFSDQSYNGESYTNFFHHLRFFKSDLVDLEKVINQLPLVESATDIDQLLSDALNLLVLSSANLSLLLPSMAREPRYRSTLAALRDRLSQMRNQERLERLSITYGPDDEISAQSLESIQKGKQNQH